MAKSHESQEFLVANTQNFSVAKTLFSGEIHQRKYGTLEL